MNEPLPAVEASPTLRTPRLVLRRFEASDLDAFHDLFSRASVCRYIPFGPLDLDGARIKLARRMQQTRIAEDGDAMLFAVDEIATGRMIGEFMLRLTSASNGQGEVGWALHPDAQGRGLATEGAREVLRFGFDEVRLHRIVAGCDPRHLASVRVMERLGMRREAEFRESELSRGEWTGMLVYAILEREWRAASA